MFSLSTPLKFVLGTTSTYLKLLEEIGLKTVDDLLLYYPRAHEDQTMLRTLSQALVGEVNTIRGILSDVRSGLTKNRKYLTKAAFIDEDNIAAEAVWFNQRHIQRLLPVGKPVILSGKLKYDFGRFSIQNPEFELLKDEQIHTGRIVPIYREHRQIGSRWFREKVSKVKHFVDMYEENLPYEVLRDEGLMNRKEAIRQIHFPDTRVKLAEARERLSFEELYFIQEKALKMKQDWQNVPEDDAKVIPMDIDFLKIFFEILPFEFTNAQKISLYEILKDMENPYPMARLLEGDVGSGKTVVVVAAMIMAMKAGFQSVVMAPTEVLSRQHFATIRLLLKQLSGHERYNDFTQTKESRKSESALDLFSAYLDKREPVVELLTGSVTGKKRKEVLLGMESGQIDIIVGTHAVIQENIVFKKLGLAVVDEQHRFGVAQRDTLKSHGSPHLLNMSATPIPRSLALTAYGHQDLSVIDEMPPGRQKIITKVVPEKERATIYKFIYEEVQKGRQVYIICPLIDESDVLEVKSAIKEYEFLAQHIFPDLRIGLMHGKLSPGEKDYVMTQFNEHDIDIMVSTSVIEVGIDVPNATIIMIEGAERFGLSQMHQFRGRVGRGTEQSYCFLFSNSRSENVYARLKYMETYDSGFQLAEIDMKTRGPGEVYGIRQSGLPDLKMASLGDSKMVARVRKAAEKYLIPNSIFSP